VTSALEHGTEDTPGRLGAVLRAVGEPRPVALGRRGPWVTTTLAQARSVLTDAGAFGFPVDVSRRSDPVVGTRDSSRPEPFATLTRESAAIAGEVLAGELRSSTKSDASGEYEAMQLLRRPVARATAAATLGAIDDGARNEVADAALDWVDALGPVIAAPAPPHRWSRARRQEDAARKSLEGRIEALGDPAPARTATMLAAGTQVPIAAGAWLLVALAERPELQERLAAGEIEPIWVVWEVLRLTPPTWATARVARRSLDLAGVRIPEGGVVVVSPLLLGRLPNLVPSGDGNPRQQLARLEAERWRDPQVRPGAWLPFGLGASACPGRSVGLAQLVALTKWATSASLHLAATPSTDQTRGIFPRPARIAVVRVEGENT
jgi:hypothetical protein